MEFREKAVVDKTKKPNTITSLIEDFKLIGLKKGDTVLVHCSMSKIGWIVGGPISVIKALQEVLTQDGTLIMPAFTEDNSNPELWQHPPVPESWWPVIKSEWPAFDPKSSPTRAMGKVSETFRNMTGVLRSNHPQVSFTAWGKYAKYIVSEHKLTPCFGRSSPLSKIYELNGKVLLLSVPHRNNTSLHLAEIIANLPNQPILQQGVAMMKDGERIWQEFTDLAYNDDDFLKIGKSFEDSIGYEKKHIGIGLSTLINQRDMVDFAVQWMKQNRNN